jgi:RNA polymerase sigma-70 factor (ECF subfamily)
MTDIQIIDLFGARSEEAISETEKKYGNLCRHIAKGVLSCEQDVDECVNDTLLAIWNTIPPENPDKLSAFICKVARNIALNKYDYISCGRRNPNTTVSMTELEDCLPDTDDVSSAVENREVIAHINDFLRRISFNDRNIFMRKYYFGDSLAHIARTFGFSESKVKSSLHRTRNKMKIYLTKKGILL